MDYLIGGQKVIIKKNKIIPSVLIIILIELSVPSLGSAQVLGIEQLSDNSLPAEESVFISDSSVKDAINEDLEQKIETETRKVLWSKSYAMTAYNSDVSQCDASPCITANGFNVCKHGIEDTVAANFLPFGTEIRIPDLFGDRVFVVRDRMNSRYQNRVDVWFKSYENAIDFGVKYATIEVLE
jgi:3D (Asp-Asp-Asp) domain-containing protein